MDKLYKSIKYIVMDLDDTLLRKDKSISEYTLETLRRVKEKGYKIVFNTSRSMQNSEELFQLVDADYGIYSGGCDIIDKNHKKIYFKAIPGNEIQKIVENLLEFCPKISIQTAEHFYASDKEYKKQNAIYYDFSKGFNIDSLKILAYTMDFERIKKLAEDFNLEHQNYLNRGWHRLSVKGATKWSGILKLLEYLGENTSTIMTFGDDFGDQEMIEKAHVGVAMANSQPVVLEHAKYVALSNNEDGLAHFLEEHLL